jgi:hypothetical protein
MQSKLLEVLKFPSWSPTQPFSYKVQLHFLHQCSKMSRKSNLEVNWSFHKCKLNLSSVPGDSPKCWLIHLCGQNSHSHFLAWRPCPSKAVVSSPSPTNLTRWAAAGPRLHAVSSQPERYHKSFSPTLRVPKCPEGTAPSSSSSDRYFVRS